MFTLYQLKSNGCFRSFYKAPFYIKNTFLMCVLAVLLFIIYAVYFRSDGGSLTSAVNILRGLNSNTFNYLQTHKHKLSLDGGVPSLGSASVNVTSINFFSECVKYNRPCKLPELALSWPAVEYWNFQNGGHKYFEELIGADTTIDTYVNDVTHDSYHTFQQGYSFPKIRKSTMTYSQFIKTFNEEKYPGTIAIKDIGLTGLTDKVIKDIVLPDFYHDIAELEGIHIYQGQHYIDKPHYERKEQIMCAVDGQLDVVLVPHIYRQEVYAGENLDGTVYDEAEFGHLSPQDQINVSPVNFFMPKKKTYPHFQNAQREVVNLKKGDCVFIPAFYFYQMQGYNLHKDYNDQFPDQQDMDAPGSYKPISTAVSLFFQGNSKLLHGFFEAIEHKIIK